MTLYETLESKYYDTVNYLDQYVPIGSVVDRVDEKIPSFMLLLIIIAIILLLLILPIRSGINFPGISFTIEKEILVLSSDNLPIKDANLLVDSECSDGPISVTTNSLGKATAVTCNNLVYIQASKNGYQTYQEEIELRENRHVIKLSPKQITFERQLKIEIVDKDGDILNEAEAEIICDNNTFTLKNQTANGWDFIVKECPSLKINASSTNYKPKTVSLLSTDTIKTIQLEKVNLEGKIFFETTYDGDGEKAEIIITNEFNETKIYSTNTHGTTSENIEQGTYTYLATNEAGEEQTGSFEVNAGDNKIIEIEFDTSGKGISDSDKKYLALEIVDELDQPVISALVNFYKEDGNKVGVNRTFKDGKTTPRVIIEGNHKGVIEAEGYQKTVIDADVKNYNEYQKVTLKKGGNKLKISVVDDVNNSESAATVQLYYNNFNGIFMSGYTDSNGELLVDYLPSGNYEVFVIDKEKKDEASESFFISGNDIITNINLVVVTGTGKLNYRFYSNEKESVEPSIVVYEENDDKLKSFEGKAERGRYSTEKIKKGTKVTIESSDRNLIPYISIPFEVTRGNNQKEIFLKTESDLPNTNSVQILLDQIYEANPLYANMSRGATRVVDGSTYWFYFSAILNNENEGALLSNFYIDENATIEGIYSIEGSKSILSKVNDGTIIEEVENENLVDNNAIQANSKISNISGKKIIPVILEVNIDGNSSGFNLFYNALHGEEESINYKRNYIVGEGFCIYDCPTFFFDNYLKWTNDDFTKLIPLVEARNDILIGDDYELKTIVRNLSDIDFGESELTNEISKNYIDNLTFLNDENSETHEFSLGPVSATTEKVSPLREKSTGTAIINQNINSKRVATADLKGTENELGFVVKNKLELKIEISPNQINVGRVYPLFLIKTRYANTTKGSPATWYAEIDGRRILDGVTDENGISIISFDTTSIEEGDKIIFTAKDDEGSIDGTLEVEATESFTDNIEDDPCLSVELNGSEYSKNNSVVNSGKGDTTNIKIKSICDEERRFYIHTDILTNIKTADIQKNSEVNITLTSIPRDNLLGVYPVQILTINGDKYSQLALIDITINDPDSCFEILNTIYDLEIIDSLSSNIINNCFSGRKDNFYPKMDISTSSVGLSHEKPGIPKIFNFTAKVTGHAYEGFINGQIKSDVIYIYENCGSDSDPYNTPKIAYDGALEYTMDAAQTYCQSLAYEGEYFEKPEPELPEEPFVDYDIYDPTTLLPIEGPTSNIIQDPDPVVETKKPNKEKRISFELENAGPASTIGTGKSAVKGEQGELALGTLPENYPEIQKWNGETNNRFGGKGGTSQLWEGTRNVGVGPYHLDNYVLEFTWTFLMDLYGNPTPGAPYPSGFNEREYWGGATEDGPKSYEVLDAKGDARINRLNYLGDGDFTGEFYAQGDRDFGWGGYDCESAHATVQVDHPRILEWMIERRAEWEQDVNIIPIEGRVYKIGSYVSDATPVPEWTNEEPLIHGYELGESWLINGAKSVYTAVCSYPQGFVNPERSLGGGGPSEVEEGDDVVERLGVLDPADPYIEYDPSGIIMYQIDAESAPKDLEVFLRDGSYFAKYVGTPTVTDNIIDFTISKNNLLGEEYAIVDIYDWAGDSANDTTTVEITTPSPRRFLWKPVSEGDSKLVILHSPRIIGNVEIYGPDGTLLEVGDSRGASNGYEDTVRFNKKGAEYPDGSYVNFGPFSCLIPESSRRVESCSPRTYTETVSNAKIKKQSFQVKLKGAPSTCASSEGDIGFSGREFVPRLHFNWDWSNIQDNQCDSTNPNYTYCDATQFSISLFKKLARIEDLLNKNRLNQVAKETAFYSYLIKDNYNENFLDDFREYYTTNFANTNPTFNEKYKFFIDNDLIEINADMNYGGIYRVEIDIEDLKEGLNSMFDGNSPVKNITVNLIPVKREANYSPFYELPINGRVGGENRDGYGIVSANELKISNDIISPVNGDGFVNINNTKSQKLDDLSSGIVFKYNKNGNMEFNPSQITPVAMSVNSNNGDATAKYKISDSSNELSSTDWKMFASSIGSRTCVDFEGNQNFNLTLNNNNSIFSNSWNGTNAGTVVLGTSFFTPKSQENSIISITPDNSNTSFSAPNSTLNNTSVLLNYYDAIQRNDYDTLKGLFNLIRDGSMCISGDSDEVKIFWNPGHINDEITDILPNNANICN